MTITPLRLVSLNLLVVLLFSGLRSWIPLSFEEKLERGVLLSRRQERVKTVPFEIARVPRTVVRPVVFAPELEAGEVPLVLESVVAPLPEMITEVPEALEVPEVPEAAEALEALEQAEPPRPVEVATLAGTEDDLGEPEVVAAEAPADLDIPVAEVEKVAPPEIVAKVPEEEVDPGDRDYEIEAPQADPPGEEASLEQQGEDRNGPTTLERYSQVVKKAQEQLGSRDWKDAVETLAEGLDLEDLVGEQRAWLLYLRAKAERRLGRVSEAAELYAEAIDFDPPGAHYKNSLAWILATSTKAGLRDVERAVSLAEEAVREGGNRPQYLDTLARAYFEAGRLSEAVGTQKQVVSRSPGKKSYRNRLDWYLEEATAAPIQGID